MWAALDLKDNSILAEGTDPVSIQSKADNLRIPYIMMFIGNPKITYIF